MHHLSALLIFPLDAITCGTDLVWVLLDFYVGISKFILPSCFWKIIPFKYSSLFSNSRREHTRSFLIQLNRWILVLLRSISWKRCHGAWRVDIKMKSLVSFVNMLPLHLAGFHFVQWWFCLRTLPSGSIWKVYFLHIWLLNCLIHYSIRTKNDFWMVYILHNNNLL